MSVELDCSDGEWFVETGACGGCGRADCHPGVACLGWRCRLCPTRWTEGWFCGPDCTGDPIVHARQREALKAAERTQA